MKSLNIPKDRFHLSPNISQISKPTIFLLTTMRKMTVNLLSRTFKSQTLRIQ